MWKLYLIEILGNSVWFFGILGVILISTAIYHYEAIEEKIIEPSYTKLRVLITCSLVCAFITILMPSKKFMYVTLGINETIDFIQNNEEAKKISSKTLQVINNKLDEYLEK